MSDESKKIVEETSEWGGRDNNRLHTVKKFADGSMETSTLKFSPMSPSELQRLRSEAPTTRLDDRGIETEQTSSLTRNEAKSGLWWCIVIVSFLILFVGTAIPMDRLLTAILSWRIDSSSGIGSAGRNGILATIAVVGRIYLALWISKVLARFVTAKLQRTE